MKVRELMRLLQDADPDAEVRLATQPTYPMEYQVRGVVTPADLAEIDPRDSELRAVVYIAEGAWIGYGAQAVWDLVS